MSHHVEDALKREYGKDSASCVGSLEEVEEGEGLGDEGEDGLGEEGEDLAQELLAELLLEDLDPAGAVLVGEADGLLRLLRLGPKERGGLDALVRDRRQREDLERGPQVALCVGLERFPVYFIEIKMNGWFNGWMIFTLRP